MSKTTLSSRDWAAPPGVLRPDLFGSLFLIGMFAFLMTNRLIPDIYTLPVGLSIRPWEPVLALLTLVWLCWLIIVPKPFPAGVVGLVALSLLVVLTLAYFWNAPGFTEYEATASRRGLIRIFLFAGLFLASYHLAYDLQSAKRVLRLIVSLTGIQAVVGIYEYVSGRSATFLHELWTGIGLTVDPRGTRGFSDSLKQRLTGELKVQSTAPHPLVFSAVLALGILIALTLFLHAPSRRSRRIYGFLLLLQLACLPMTNSRTGFLVLIAGLVVLALLTVRKWPSSLPMALLVTMFMGIVFALVPGSARLLLNSFTRPQEDPNLEVRLARFDRLPDLMADRPALGAGYLTNDVNIIVFDNSYNLALVELGVIGFVLLVTFFLVCMGRSLSGLARAGPAEIPLQLAGVVGVLALLAGAATFDAWAFDQFFPTCLILLGIGVGRADVIRRRLTLSASQGSGDFSSRASIQDPAR